MIPQVSRGAAPGKLMEYLAGPGNRDEHERPHLVSGSPHLMAWYSHEELDEPAALTIGAELDQAHQVYGVDVKGGHVWHCSLSLYRQDGVLTDEQWERISTDFVRRMGYIGVEGKADTPWVAVRHGLSGTTGNDHVHVVVSLVRTDGTKADTWMDYRRAQDAARELEKEHGLTQVKGDLSPIYPKRGEAETAQERGRPELERDTLERCVRAASVASTSEGEFVRRLRGDGLLVKASLSGETVRGYAVALHPVRDEPPIYYAGSKLARDLGLGALRQRWEDTRESRLEADAEWTAATRGLRIVAPGREQDDPTFTPSQASRVMDAWQSRLASLDPADQEGWRSASADLAGAFAHWSRVTEPVPGELAALSKELSRSAQVSRREYRPAPQDRTIGAATSLMLTWASTQGDARAALAVFKRMTALAGAIREHQQARGDLVRQHGLERVARDQLVGLNERMHDRAGMILPTRAPVREQAPAASVLPPVMTRQDQKTRTGEMSR